MYRFTVRPTRALHLLLWLVAIAGAIPAQAAWKYTSIDYPGATSTGVYGLNDRGEAVGQATVGATTIGFTYNTKKSTFTVLPNVPGAPITNTLAINNAGVVVGSAGDGTDDRGIILDKGAFSFFTNPGWALTSGRGISNNGLVAGYSSDSTGSSSVGFIYDPSDNSFSQFLPSAYTSAQGINSRKQVVGHVTLDANVAYPGAPAGGYGFLREVTGAIIVFQVNDAYVTRARGITNSGLITGFFRDIVTGTRRGFFAQLAASPAFQAVTVQGDGLLDMPGGAETVPEAINNSGHIAGVWIDAAGNGHGFFAAPVPGKK